MRQKRYTRRDLIKALQALAARLGHTPLQREVDADSDSPCRVTHVRRFGSWNAALEAAGLPLNRPPMPYDREMLLETLRQLADRLGRAPVTRELVEHSLPCQATYTARFGSWTAALAEIGLQPKSSKPYERDELLNVLREVAAELGRPPTKAELWEREGLPRPTTYRYRFRGWNRALKAAGLTPSHPRGKRE